MLRRLRKAKKEYNNLLKGNISSETSCFWQYEIYLDCFLFYVEKSRLMEEASFASISHDSSYSFEFGPGSNKGEAEVTGKSGGNISSRFKRGVRRHGDVKRDLKLPAINTTPNDQQNVFKSSSKKDFDVFSKGHRKTESTSASNRHTSIRSMPSMARSIASVELGGGDDDLGKLIALRSLGTELQQYLANCKNSLHKRPWNKVHQR